MIYISEVRMSAGGSAHAHIADVRCREPDTGATGENARAQMIDWINEGDQARLTDGIGDDVRVGVANATQLYIRTYADGAWTDNLLSLPHY